jgi:hypothetical protein
MQNNAMSFYIYLMKVKKISLEILSNGKIHNLFSVWLQISSNYLKN